MWPGIWSPGGGGEEPAVRDFWAAGSKECCQGVKLSHPGFLVPVWSQVEWESSARVVGPERRPEEGELLGTGVPSTSVPSGRADLFFWGCGPEYGVQERGCCWDCWVELKWFWLAVGGVLPGVPSPRMGTSKAGVLCWGLC